MSSSASTIYAVDTCSITALKRRYPPTIFAPAWALMDALVAGARLVSSEEVLEELRAFDDECLRWAERHEHIFLPSDGGVQLEAKRIINKYPGLVDLKQPKSGADPFLIAVARVHGAAVVTEEQRAGARRSSRSPPCACGRRPTA